MQPEYQDVVDFSTILPFMVAIGIHAAIAAIELVLALYLLVSGARGLALLASGDAGPGHRGGAAVRIVLGISMLLPIAAGVSWLVSFAACVGTLGLLTVAERQPPTHAGRSSRRWLRRLGLAGTGLLTLFLAWEQADAASLVREILTTQGRWREAEVAWQNSNDVTSPKVGDLAPDFELQDVDGNTTAKLSAFRGSRPVALVFGSYT